MDEQSQSATSATYELVTLTNALMKTDVLERLRIGHGLLSRTQFMMGLQHGDIDVWSLANHCYALVQWGESIDGKVLNILTTVGHRRYAKEAMLNLENYARKQSAAVVMSVGRPGWTDTVKEIGYEVIPVILMRKKL